MSLIAAKIKVLGETSKKSTPLFALGDPRRKRHTDLADPRLILSDHGFSGFNG